MQGDVVGKTGGDELHQRINALKERRKNDKINLILYAAAKGDLSGLTDALKVRKLISVSRGIFVLKL